MEKDFNFGSRPKIYIVSDGEVTTAGVWSSQSCGSNYVWSQKKKKKAMYTCIAVLGVVVCSVCSDADVRVQRSLISVWCKAGSPVITDWLIKGWTANVWAEQTESWTSHPSQGSWAEEPVRRSWLGGRWGSRKKGRRRWPWGWAWGVTKGVSPWQHDCRAVD